MSRCDSPNQSGRSKKFDKKYFLSSALPFTMCRKYLMPHHSTYNIFCSVEKTFLINFPFRVRVLYLGPGCGSRIGMNNSLFYFYRRDPSHEAGPCLHNCLFQAQKGF